MQKIRRADAIARGLKYYYTGKPCKHGHKAPRRVDNWACMECLRQKDKTALVTLRVPPQHVELIESIAEDLRKQEGIEQ